MKGFAPTSRARIALGLAALLQTWLFVDSHHHRSQRLVQPAGQNPNEAGEGLVIRGNGLGYYAWLRSLVIDHDWNFGNEFDEHRPSGDWVPPPSSRTPVGLRSNQWSVGPACAWAVSVVPLHYFLKLLGTSSPWAANGYSFPYQIAVGATTVVIAILGLFSLYGICRHYVSPPSAALAAVTVWFGTSVVYYASVEVSMAHGIGGAALAATIRFWLKSYHSVSPARWFGLGLLLGATALVRWQLATFAILPVGELLLRLSPSSSQAGIDWHLAARKALLLLPMLGGALLVFFPQMLAWHVVYGEWFVQPVPGVVPHWTTPSFAQLLVSMDRGLFYSTPLAAVAFFGLALAAFPSGCPVQPLRRAEDHWAPVPGAATETLRLLFGAFLVHLYCLAIVWGKGRLVPETGMFEGVFLSSAYGMRHLSEAVLTLAPGLAVLLEKGRTRCSPARNGLCVAVFCLSFWNLLMVVEHSRGLLPPDRGLDLGSLFTIAAEFAGSNMLVTLLLAETIGMIFLILLWDKPDSAI